jgi:hypothetical protein
MVQKLTVDVGRRTTGHARFAAAVFSVVVALLYIGGLWLRMRQPATTAPSSGDKG